MEQFKNFGTNLTNQNSIQEEIHSRSKGGNACLLACVRAVQNWLTSSSLSKNLKIQIHSTIILPVVLYERKIVTYFAGGT